MRERETWVSEYIIFFYYLLKYKLYKLYFKNVLFKILHKENPESQKKPANSATDRKSITESSAHALALLFLHFVKRGWFSNVGDSRKTLKTVKPLYINKSQKILSQFENSKRSFERFHMALKILQARGYSKKYSTYL